MFSAKVCFKFLLTTFLFFYYMFSYLYLRNSNLLHVYLCQRKARKKMVLLIEKDKHIDTRDVNAILSVWRLECNMHKFTLQVYKLPYPPSRNTSATNTNAFVAGISKAVVVDPFETLQNSTT